MIQQYVYMNLKMISRMFKWSIITDFYFYTAVYFLGSKYFFHKTFLN